MGNAQTGGRPYASPASSPLPFTIPPLPARFVHRDRLERLLDEAVVSGTAIVSAPAGSGKTLLVAGWAAGRHPRAAWLSVEAEDADPHQFWGRVLSALQAAEDVPPDSLLATMHAPPLHDARFLSVLLAACHAVGGPRILVLDDVHLLAGTPALTSLSAALRRGLGALRLVVSTRSDTHLPLQKLRLSDRLTTIRAADMAFGPEEATELLAAHSVTVSTDQLAALLARTEGWAAGLRLAALSLQKAGTSEQVETIVGGLTGDRRDIADYFTEEVLEDQEPDLIQFLLDTSVVRRICAELAHALTGRTDSHRQLIRLERENLFVIALDDRRRWYRYHHLFADLLHHRLLTEDPTREQELHRRAAAWFAANEEPLETVRHLGAAQEWTLLARYVLRHAGVTMLGPDRAVLVESLRHIPAELIARDAEVAVACAAGSYADYDAAGVASHLRRARDLLPALSAHDAPMTTAVVSTLEALLAWLHADPAAQVSTSRTAIQQLDQILVEEMPAAPVYRLAVTTVEAMGHLWTGELGEAESLLNACISVASTNSTMAPVLAVHLHGNMAVLKAMGGRLLEARRDVDIALATAEESGWAFMPLAATAFLGEAIIRLLEADAQAGTAVVERGRGCVSRVRDRYVETALGLIEARMEITLGRPQAARSVLLSLRQRTHGWVVPLFLAQWRILTEAEILLAEHRVQEVIDRLSDSSFAKAPLARPYAHRTVLLARARWENHQPQECLDLLDALRAEPWIDRVPATEAWLLTALANDRLRDDAQAHAALTHALDIAAPEHIIRPFLLVDANTVLRLLRRHRTTDATHGAFAGLLLERLAGGTHALSRSQALDPLTPRERSVLMLLPTMMSNTEIADELYISVNTVKAHLKTMYRKLGVTTRRQAVAMAGEIGLLSMLSPGASTGSPAAGEVPTGTTRRPEAGP